MRLTTLFLIVAAMSAALNGFGMHLATHYLGMHYLAAQVICTFGVLIIGFVFNRESATQATRAAERIAATKPSSMDDTAGAGTD